MTVTMTRPTPEWSAMGAAESEFDLSVAFAEHGPSLLGFAVNALRDRPLAEDCVQETFLRAWRSRSGFDADRGSARTWLFTIERHVILDVYRARQRTPTLVPAEHAGELAAQESDPLERLRIVEALARVSPEQREAVVAVHLTGLTYQEFSVASGVPVATLRTRVFYALRAMRGHLEGVDND